MNAVKRCLALFAATLVVGACGGDPTAGDAGADLTIRATPGAVWVRNNATASVIIEAVDKLGGPVEGSWTAGAPTGPFTITVDPTYRPSSTGAIGTATKFIVDPTTEGEGSVVITGTGGAVTVPIRIAPDTNLFAVVISDLAPTIGDTITITAPAGTRFTAATTVNFYNGALPLNLQQGAVPKIVTMNAPDSTVLTVVPPAGAEGKARITGIANVSTPSLTVAARSAGSVALVDTKTLTATYSTGTTAIPANTTITYTLTQPGYRLRTGAGAAADTTSITAAYVGSSMGGVVGNFIDSTHMTIFAPPGFNNQVRVNKLFHAAQSFYNLSLPGLDTLQVDSLPQIGLGQDNPDDGPIGLVTLPAMNVNDVYVFWDNATFTSPDITGIGQQDADQHIEVVITTAGRYRFAYAWDNTADVDAYLLDATLSVFRATCGSCGGNPELLTTSAVTPLAAGSHQVLAATIWSGSKPIRLRVIVTRLS